MAFDFTCLQTFHATAAPVSLPPSAALGNNFQIASESLCRSESCTSMPPEMFFRTQFCSPAEPRPAADSSSKQTPPSRPHRTPARRSLPETTWHLVGRSRIDGAVHSDNAAKRRYRIAFQRPHIPSASVLPVAVPQGFVCLIMAQTGSSTRAPDPTPLAIDNVVIGSSLPCT